MRRQKGEVGWRRAQEREVMEGWAGEVIGAMGLRVDGRGEGLLGKRMGEVKGLRGPLAGTISSHGRTYGQFSREISARESTIVSWLGHESFGG